MVEFRYLQPHDAEAAAKIHVEGQPGTVLTLLGERFLVELYHAMTCSEWAEGIGAFDNGELVAQAAVAVSSSKFFAEFKAQHLWRVTIPVTLSVLRKPKIFAYFAQSWRYAEFTRSPEGEGDAIFLGVRKKYLRHGLAPELVRHMFGWAGQVGLKSANLMIEKSNRPMRWMISHLNGLYVAYEFEVYGRPMLFYKVPIALNLADAKLPLGQPYVPAYQYSNNGRE